MTEKTANRVSRRIPRAQVLAFFALNGTEAQQPYQVEFKEYRYIGKTYRIITVEVDDDAAVQYWAQVLDLPKSTRDFWTSTDSDGDGWAHYSRLGKWRGFSVELKAKVPTVATAAKGLDEATREQLQQLVDQQLVDDEPRCGTCGEPASLLASGAVSHAGDGRGGPCGPAGSDRGVPDLRTDDDPYCCPVSDERAPVDVEVVTGPAALAGHVPGEVYERDEPITVRAQPPCDPCTMGEHCQQCGCCNGLLDGFPVGRGPGRRGLPFADVDPSTVVIR